MFGLCRARAGEWNVFGAPGRQASLLLSFLMFRQVMVKGCGSSQEIMPFMAPFLTVDKAGRVVIPKALREELRLEPGDSLEMERLGEAITLRPVRGSDPLTRKQGVWVFHSGQPLSASATDVVLRQVRENGIDQDRGVAERPIAHGWRCGRR